MQFKQPNFTKHIPEVVPNDILLLSKLFRHQASVLLIWPRRRVDL